MMTKMNSNHEKFDKIVNLYDKKIDSVISSFEKNYDNAKDIKQDLYLKLFAKNLHVEECINVWSWLKTVVSNHCKNHIRDNSKIKFYDLANNESDLNIYENIEDKKADLDSKYNHEEVQDYIYSCIKKLKPKYKDVIILYDFENLSYEEISKRIDCPVGTVKSR